MWRPSTYALQVEGIALEQVGWSTRREVGVVADHELGHSLDKDDSVLRAVSVRRDLRSRVIPVGGYGNKGGKRESERGRREEGRGGKGESESKCLGKILP